MSECRECVILGRQCDECTLRAELAEMKQAVRDLRAALGAACEIRHGAAMFTTANGIPMEMPKRSERIVREALAATAHLVAEEK